MASMSLSCKPGQSLTIEPPGTDGHPRSSPLRRVCWSLLAVEAWLSHESAQRKGSSISGKMTSRNIERKEEAGLKSELILKINLSACCHAAPRWSRAQVSRRGLRRMRTEGSIGIAELLSSSIREPLIQHVNKARLSAISSVEHESCWQ